MTRRIVLCSVLCLSVVGCRSNTEGPREVMQKTRAGDRADLPGYTISEQRQRGRERYTITEDDPRIAPPVFIGRPDPLGHY
jgi:hypothetical protein